MQVDAVPRKNLKSAQRKSTVRTDGRGSPPAGADMEMRILASLQLCIAVFNRRSGVVLWRSPSFDTLSGESVQTVAALCRRISGLDDALSLLGADGSEPTEVAVQVLGKSYEAALTTPAPDVVVLRLEDRSAQARARQRHLEDREQLLFTSRVLSMGEMATTLAHEINQPIGAAANLLRGSVMRLQRQADDGAANSAQTDLLQALRRATDQVLFASKVISRIREYTHSHTVKRVRVDVLALLRSCASLLDWEIEREGVSLEMNLPNEPLWIKADEVMLQQLFVNLMRNAIDAMSGNLRGEKLLRLTAHVEGPQVEVTVSDCGCGISEEAEQTLFVPFVSSKPTGTGIGLNICRSFVELHQGRLWFSRNEGSGISFHAALPLMPSTITTPSQEHT